MPQRNLLFTIAYDGTNYHGWQVQANAVSVQDVFQNALRQVLGSIPDVKGCSRTDTGVHARQFCISLHTDSAIACERLVAALNRYLPYDVAVLACREVNPGFHARYDCVGKEYQYQIWDSQVKNPFLQHYALHYPYAINEQLLNLAAQGYVGRHDFTSFCSAGAKCRSDNIRTVQYASFERTQEHLCVFTVAADGFLYNMVRIMVGTLLRVAQGRFAPDCAGQIIARQDRAAAGPTVEAQGLYLNRVFYNDELSGGKL